MRRFAFFGLVVLVVAGCIQSSQSATTTGTSMVTSTPSSTSVAPSTSSTAQVQPSATTTTSTTTTSTTTPPHTTVAADTTPPALEVSDPRPRATVTEYRYRFVGTTEPGASVVAAGRYPVEVDAGGNWSIVLILNPGGNVATFVATDPAGNTSEVRVPVYLQACLEAPEIAMPEAVSNAISLTADLDGDGNADTVTTYFAQDRWRLHLELAYGWETDTDITTHVTDPRLVTNATAPSPIRTVNLGLPTVLVELGGNLVGYSYGFVALTGCTLQPVLGPDEAMPVIWEGIGIHHSEFFRCEPGAVTQVQMGRNETWIGITETRYPFSTASTGFGAPTVTEEKVNAPPIPTDGSDDTAWTDEVARRRKSACRPW